ncbi:MAG: hypothetical protein CMJ64_26245 [Planctomycetaceae bacterium]|nr:hypothetical protein [Planctomycetaceae bacterium]
MVYVAVGQDPEHGEGVGHVWCLDPTKRGIAPVDASAALAEVDVAHKAIDALIENLPVGDLRSGALRSAQQELRESKQAIQSLALLQHDVSPQLAVKLKKENRVPVEHRRLQAVIEEEGEVAIDNPNSAVVWHYTEFDQTGDGEIDFEEQMHRSCGTVAIQNDLLYIADFSGLFHCLDAKSGKVHWTYDMLAAAWGSPCIVDGHVYIGDEDGDVCIFELSAEPHEPIAEINMGNSVYSTPIVANNILYIANKTHIFAIEAPKGAE